MKKVISVILCLALVFACSGAVFAEETAAPVAEPAAPEVIKLSLEEAVTIMQTTGSSAEMAQINKKSDEAVAAGRSESAKSLKDQLDYLESLSGMVDGGAYMTAAYQYQAGGVTVSNQKIVAMQRDFAKANVDNNYKAELNQIEADTVETYYTLLQARENLRVLKENLQVQKDILANVEKKYSLGVVAKIDLISAQDSVVTAQQNVTVAESGAAAAAMSFNLMLGYDLLQEVELTTALEMVEAPTITLDEAIASAKANRLELQAMDLLVDVQTLLMNSLSVRYPKSSAKYMDQQVALLSAQKLQKDTPLQLEMGIRIAYRDLQDKASAVESARSTLAFAEEGYKISLVSFDAGMSTLSAVQEAQIRVLQANQGVLAAINAYDLAVCDFGHAIGVGVTRLSL